MNRLQSPEPRSLRWTRYNQFSRKRLTNAGRICDPPEVTNLDRQLYSSDGDASLILVVLLLPLFFSAISLAAVILENSLVSGTFFTNRRFSHSTSEARELVVDSCRPFAPLSLLPSGGRHAPAYYAVRVCYKSLLLNARNIIFF